MAEQPGDGQVTRLAANSGITVQARILGRSNHDVTILLTLYNRRRQAGFKLASVTAYTATQTLPGVMSGKHYLAPERRAKVAVVVPGLPRGMTFELFVTDKTETTTIIIEGLTAP